MILLEIVDFLHIFVDGLRKLRKIWFKTCTVPRKKPNSNQKACGFFVEKRKNVLIFGQVADIIYMLAD